MFTCFHGCLGLYLTSSTSISKYTLMFLVYNNCNKYYYTHNFNRMGRLGLRFVDSIASDAAGQTELQELITFI
jgi:hypothetical protein